MVSPFDYLDSMGWDIVISAVLLAATALLLPYKASSGSVEPEGRNLRVGFAAALGASGLYLFITGIAISSWRSGSFSSICFYPFPQHTQTICG